MILYPPAKINLGLYVTEKRNDGFHNIETTFFPIGLTDILEFFYTDQQPDDSMSVSGLDVPGNSADNLVLRACRLFRREFDIPPLMIHLHKHIPMGAGLGGGSSDAAYMLRGLNELSGKPFSGQKLKELSLELGSDCPFFIGSKPAIGKGRGELLEEVEINLAGKYLYLFNPGIHVSTKEAYAGVKIGKPGIELAQMLKLPVQDWKGRLLNNFEDTVFKDHPEIADLKSVLYEEGAIYAGMSGSGSTVFGIFDTEMGPDLGNSEMLVWHGAL